MAEQNQSLEPSRTGSRSVLTVQQDKLLDVGVEIGGTALDQYPSFMSFTHPVLCQVGLPRSKVEGRSFIRKSGEAWVQVAAGTLDEGDGPVEQVVPYGVMPRLVLAHLSTHAKRFKTREIPIGASATKFLRVLGLDGQGGYHRTLKQQMYALAACSITLGFRGKTVHIQPVEEFEAWSRFGKKWSGSLVLSEGFYKSLEESAVPLDLRALHGLSDSALAWDIYAWLAHRLHRIEGRPIIIHWKSLLTQFGQEYQGKNPTKDFSKKFSAALKKVELVYPSARVKAVKGGVMLMSSPPPIPKVGA
jgi:hypothetical protein